MAEHQVFFKRSAEKELAALPVRIQEKVIDAVRLLAINPMTHLLDVKKLSGSKNRCRVRISDYRLVYSIEANELKVLVIRMGHRLDVYH